MADALIEVQDLRKEFRQGFWMRRVEALKRVSFSVERGDIFGFLGPNGAGKTTTLKILAGLIRPSSGQAKLFGQPVPNAKMRGKLGFLPESPYVYPYLTPWEFVTLCGRLSGLRGGALRDRSRAVLEQTGIYYAADRPVRRLSKGMLQRTGLAAALVGDPELLMLDEPMSGLDPVGRKEVRDLILSERASGRTILFCTHILGDVELLCDRVTILSRGEVVVSGVLRELLKGEVQRTDISLLGAPEPLLQQLAAAGHGVRRSAARTVVEVEGQAHVAQVLKQALEAGVEVREVVSRQETLEALFVREAIEAPKRREAEALSGAGVAPTPP